MRIQDEIATYEGNVPMDDGTYFNLPWTLKKTDRYCNSQFMSALYDKDGFKKLFYNISRRPLKASQKAVEIDTKNIIAKAKDGASYLPAWLMNMELKQFMKDNGFAILLNQITERYPKYGEVIVKDVAGVPEVKVLKNLRWEPSVHIEKSPWIHEDHIYSLEEYLIEAQKKGWDEEATKMIKEKSFKEPSKLIKLVERTGYFTRADFDENAKDKEEIVYGMILMSADDTNTDSKKKVNDDYLKLSDLRITSKILVANPYRSLSWEEVDGRGLGVGVPEEMFGFQEFYNDVNNKERKALEWNSKKLFQSKNPLHNKNLFRQKKNGDVIDDPNLQEIPIQERNLASYLNLYDRITNTSNGMTFTHEINTGQTMPSGTPFRLGAVMAGAVDSYFNFKREKLGIFLQGIIKDFVIPSFRKDKRKSHILNFEADGENLRKIDEMIVNELMREAVDKFEKKNGSLPSMEEYQRERTRVEELTKRKTSRFLELPDRFYDNASFYIDIIITGEQENTEADIQSLSTLYQIMAEKGDPRSEDVLDRALNKAGQNPVSFKTAKAPANPTGNTQLKELLPANQQKL